MTVLVILTAAAVSALLLWFFFGPKPAQDATLDTGVQRATVVVAGGYSPDLIHARQGIPLQLTFDRRESGDCTSQVLFPELHVAAALPAYARTTVDVLPERPGRYGFACGMNMVHGTLVVEPADDSTPVTEPADASTHELPPADGPQPALPDDDTAARRAEIADLTRRVLAGAVLTLPVLVTVMAVEVFHATWVPDVLMNRWLQLALITPVMLYVGWPIHRTGWLTLRHRSADMNTLIAIGTTAAFGYSLLVTLAPGLFPADVREVYFEAVGVILTLILLGRLFEAKAKAGTGEAIRQLDRPAAAHRPGPPRRRRARGRHRRGGARRHRDRPPRREDPGRRRGRRGPLAGRRVDGDRRADAGDQAGRRHGHRRHRQPDRRIPLPGGEGRRGHHARPDHPPGPAGAGIQRAHPAPRRRQSPATSSQRRAHRGRGRS